MEVWIELKWFPIMLGECYEYFKLIHKFHENLKITRSAEELSDFLWS
jgi:hypothetical protein